MALSEGFKSFVDFFKNSFTDPADEIENPDDVFGDFGNGYGIDNNLALQPKKDELDNIYPGSYSTNVTAKRGFTDRFKSEPKVTPLPTNAYKSAEITIIEPRSFSESAQIVKNLIDKKTVVLHLDLLDKEQSQRTIDFVCGASHALKGSVQKISDGVVIFAPENIALSAETAVMQNKFSEINWNKPL